MARPNFAAARDVASSPSGWASFIDAAGLKPNGSETCHLINKVRTLFVSAGKVGTSHTLLPRKSALVSILSTLIKTRGRIL